MAEPYVKDAAITYNQFEQIYNMLSLKEKYTVAKILYNHGIDLITEEERGTIEEDTYEDLEENIEESVDNFSILYDEDLFTDANYNHEINDSLIINKNVKQSNEILCKLIQQGNMQAKQDLCVKNKRLVAKYAYAYSKKYRHHLDFDDLEQVGYLGLITAAKKFDIKKGYAFSTYAVWWIKQAITREIFDNGFTIRLPVHMMERINKINFLERKYINFNNDECIKMIADETGMNVDMVRECMVIKNNILKYASLNSPIGETEDTELVEFIPTEDDKTIEDLVAEGDLRKHLYEVLETLTQREQRVLRLRFGLDDSIPRTLENVGQQFMVTRERIRQIEAKALRKLRYPSRLKKLKGFL